MSGEANDRTIKRLLQQAIASLELAMELMSETKVKRSKEPPSILSTIAKRKLAELRQAENESRRHK